MERKPNRLIDEKSPYLLQHAYNPVDWHPWGEAAFAKALAEDKPVFLSIGYATCHWCHVMERESFEDEEVAALMNATVVAVKVDREERPDLDLLYMSICQAMTGRGGWPLNLILTPDGKPFFAGTYFPKESSFGRPGFKDILQRIHLAWSTRRGEVMGSATSILSQISSHLEALGRPDAAAPELDEGTLQAARDALAADFDAEHGGFGQAPKFPSPHALLFLLRYARRAKDEGSLAMAEKTLTAMRLGGIHDQVGGGFHRYSTDAHWFLPHFEKMLYDQAMLTMAYTEAFQATGKKAYKDTALAILEYVRRDLTGPEGAFYSAEDADSEGVEGKFYVWTKEQVRAALPPEDADLVLDVYGITPEGNFREEATGVPTGANIPFLAAPLAETAAAKGLSPAALEERLARCRTALLAAREGRVRPLRDDKVLTDWNGLMLAALAKAARAFDDETLARRAEAAADFLLTRLRGENGRLIHRFRDGQAAVPGMLDDYAFLAWGLVELYQTVFRTDYLRAALDLVAVLREHFRDPDGGFYQTADDAEALLIRQKVFLDAAVPSGNSVAFLVLVTLFRLTGQTALKDEAAALAKAAARQVAALPAAYGQFGCALALALGPNAEVTVAGDPDAPDTHALIRALNLAYLPETAVLLRPDEEAPEIARIAPFTRFQLPVDGRAAAHVCRAGSCQPPTTDPDAMLRLLGK